MGMETERSETREAGGQMPEGQRRAFTQAERRRQCMRATIQKPICCWNGACDGGSHAAVRPSVRPSVLPTASAEAACPQQAQERCLFRLRLSYAGI